MADTLQDFIDGFEARAKELSTTTDGEGKDQKANGTEGTDDGETTKAGGDGDGDSTEGDRGKGGTKTDGKADDKTGKSKPTGADKDGNDGDGKTGDDDTAADGEGDAEAGAHDDLADDDPVRLKKDLERARKRFKDTQASWTKEHQARLDLEKRLTALEAKQTATTDKDNKTDGKDGKPQDDWNLNGGGKDDGQDGDETGLAKEIRAMRQELQEVRKRERVSAWNAAEAKVEKENSDYREVVYDVFQPEVERNEKLMQEFREKGATPEAAYELGQRLIEEQIGKLPKALRERIKPSTETEGDDKDDDDGEDTDAGSKPKPPQKRKPSTLDDVAGDRGGRRTGEQSPRGLLDEALADIRPGSRKQD